MHHPYYHVTNLVKNSRIAQLNLSYYSYQPQSSTDERQSFSLKKEDFLNPSLMEEIAVNCPFGHELAIHSTVKMDNEDIRHIPMIDMASSSKAQILRLNSFLGDHFFKTFSWYSSGRSFHGYGGILLSEKEWIGLMGTLLLANQINLVPIVDPRWIGHRLISGYAALRWTKNTDFYISAPKELVGV